MQRTKLVKKYLKGKGIEIGALHHPVQVPKSVKVTYVDRMEEGLLRTHYPELKDLPLVKVDTVDDGEKLSTFSNNSQDFIIANHFIEHTQDPIGTILRHLAVLKPNGILYMAVPDKRYTFDKDRPLTTFEHLVEDHIAGPEGSYLEHVREYVSLVDKLQGQDFEEKMEYVVKANYSIHFHVWDHQSFESFVREIILKRFSAPARLEEVVPNKEHGECICIMRKV